MGGLDRMSSSERQGNSPTGNPDADALLRTDGNAIVIALLLDQQVRAEMAFEGPYKIKERLGHLDVGKIADMDEHALRETFGQKPAVHRFYNMMAGRVKELAQFLVNEYDSDASALWADDADLDAVEKRVFDLPGFGAAKAGAIGHALQLFGHRRFESE
jgi:uncharacterized HhH-GPD family protein